MLRKTGVVGKFVEYYGEGLTSLPLADRATIGNMSPEYGATCGFFPVDNVTLDYLRLTGRSPERIALVEAYCKENMLWHDPSEHATYTEIVELDLGDVEPSLAGPRRPQDRVPLASAKEAFLETLGTFGVALRNGSHDKAVADTFPASDPTTEQQPGGAPEPEPDNAPVATASAPGHKRTPVAGADYELDHGSVVIAAITSCTNTSNPQVMVAAGLLARNAVERGLQRQPWVKSSLAPGSKVVTRYYEQAGLQEHLDTLGFNTVGYGCTTCIGNSGPLADEIVAAVGEGDLVVCSVLSGQPQLRGAHPSRGEGELPRLAAARRRLFARRPHGHRLGDRAGRHGLRRRGRLPARHLAEREGGQRHDRHLRARRALLRHVRGRLHRRRAVARPARAGRRALRMGAGVDVRAAPALLRRHEPRAGIRRRHRRRARARVARRLGDDRPHLTRRLDPAGLARRRVSGGARRRSARTSTPTVRGAATTR